MLSGNKACARAHARAHGMSARFPFALCMAKRWMATKWQYGNTTRRGRATAGRDGESASRSSAWSRSKDTSVCVSRYYVIVVIPKYTCTYCICIYIVYRNCRVIQRFCYYWNWNCVASSDAIISVLYVYLACSDKSIGILSGVNEKCVNCVRQLCNFIVTRNTDVERSNRCICMTFEIIFLPY